MSGVFTLTRDADPDLASQNDADADPHNSLLYTPFLSSNFFPIFHLASLVKKVKGDKNTVAEPEQQLVKSRNQNRNIG